MYKANLSALEFYNDSGIVRLAPVGVEFRNWPLTAKIGIDLRAKMPVYLGSEIILFSLGAQKHSCVPANVMQRLKLLNGFEIKDQISLRL